VPSSGPPIGKPELRALQSTLEAMAERRRDGMQPTRSSSC
jgi:hypothetical protein